jgi:hypothetical protein
MEVMQSSGAVGEDVKVLVELGLVVDTGVATAPTQPAALVNRPRALGAR